MNSNLGTYLGANTKNVITELGAVLSAPLYQHLLSPAAIGKLKAVIERPYTPGAPFRVRANNLSSFFANASKAYHSGKGDDFESVAVVFGNPYLPISLSDAGLVTNKNDTSSVSINEVTTETNNSGNEITRTKKVSLARTGKDLWEAMMTYGGHYITVNLDIDDLLVEAAKPRANAMAKYLAPRGKGKQRVQIDYLIIQKGNPDTIYILELKAGKTHLVMDEKEEQQMSKAAWVFRKWYKDAGKPIPTVKLLYHPFLSDKLPAIIPGHTSENVTYLTLEGLCQFLALDPILVERLGSMRASYRKNMATFESRLTGALFKNRNRRIASAQANLNRAALAKTAEGELREATNNLNILSGNASRAIGQNVSKLFGNRLSSTLNVSKDSDWKQVVQYVTYLISKKRNLQTQAKNNPLIYKDIYDIIRSILKLNSNRGERILNPAARNQFIKFKNAAANVYPNSSANVDPDIKEAYLINYIQLRAKVLSSQAPANLARVSNGAFRRPTKEESTVAAKSFNINALLTNKSTLNKYKRLQEIRELRPNNRGKVGRNLASANNKVWRASSAKALANFRASSNRNSANATLRGYMSEINQLLSYLRGWATNALQPGAITNQNKAKMTKIISGTLAEVQSAHLSVTSVPKKPPPKPTGQRLIEAQKRAAEEIGRLMQRAPAFNNQNNSGQ